MQFKSLTKIHSREKRKRQRKGENFRGFVPKMSSPQGSVIYVKTIQKDYKSQRWTMTSKKHCHPDTILLIETVKVQTRQKKKKSVGFR